MTNYTTNTTIMFDELNRCEFSLKKLSKMGMQLAEIHLKDCEELIDHINKYDKETINKKINKYKRFINKIINDHN